MLSRIILGAVVALSPYLATGANFSNSHDNTCSYELTNHFTTTFLSVSQLSAAYAGFGPDQGDEPGYDINQTLGAIWVDGATNWEFEFTDPFGNVLIYQSGSFSNTIILDAIDGLCYGTNYDVRVRPFIGAWCAFGPSVNIIMENNPSTRVQDVFCNATVGLYTIVQCEYIGNAQEYMWQFITDNGNQMFEYSSGDANLVILDDIPQMRYNKIYQIFVKAKVCDTWGTYSNMCILTTAPLPYTNLTTEFCGIAYTGVVQFEWVPGATEYWCRVFEVDPDDPNVTPLGPVHMFYVDDPAGVVIPLYQLELEQPNVYAVQVKPFVGEQEGDYGPPCLIYYGIDPPMFADGENQSANGIESENLESLSIDVYPNPNAGERMYFNMPYEVEDLTIEIFNSNGKTVFLETLIVNPGVTEITFDQRLSSGIYMVRMSSENEWIATSRFIAH